MKSEQNVQLDGEVDNQRLQNLTKFCCQSKLVQATIQLMIGQFLEKQKAQELRELFAKIDANGDGKLSLEELINALKDQDEEEIKEIFKRVDTDNSVSSTHPILCRASSTTPSSSLPAWISSCSATGRRSSRPSSSSTRTATASSRSKKSKNSWDPRSRTASRSPRSSRKWTPTTTARSPSKNTTTPSPSSSPTPSKAHSPASQMTSLMTPT